MEVTVKFTLKEGVTPEELVETLKVLTFTEGMSFLEEQVEEFETGDTIYVNQ